MGWEGRGRAGGLQCWGEGGCSDVSGGRGSTGVVCCCWGEGKGGGWGWRWWLGVMGAVLAAALPP